MIRVGFLLCVAACGSGTRVAPASPSAWCYGCDGKTVYAPNASFLIMTTWDATCKGGGMRSDDQIHPCDPVEHDSTLTCTREGGGGACQVTVVGKDQVRARPSEPGTYRIAVTMKPSSGKPHHQDLGTVVIAKPEQFDVTCTMQRNPDGFTMRVATKRGADVVHSRAPTAMTLTGATCEMEPVMGDSPPQPLHTIWCQPRPPSPTIEVDIKSPALEAKRSVTCVEAQ